MLWIADIKKGKKTTTKKQQINATLSAHISNTRMNLEYRLRFSESSFHFFQNSVFLHGKELRPLEPAGPQDWKG